MSTPVNCPNCGGQLPPGAPSCARCGQRFDVEPEAPEEDAPVTQAPLPPKPASATPSPRVSEGTGAAASGDVGKAFQQYLAEARERWGIEPSPFFIAIAVLAVLSLLIGSVAHASYLTAGADEVDKQFDDAVWLTTAIALALGALILSVFVRYEATRSPVAADTKSIDFRIALGIAALALLWALLGVIVGMSGRFEAAESWTRYSAVFSFLGAAWLALSQPVPAMLGTTKATTIGIGVLGVALVMLLIGQIQGMSNSYDSYVGGLAWQAMSISVLTLALGWFLGMQPKR